MNEECQGSLQQNRPAIKPRRRKEEWAYALRQIKRTSSLAECLILPNVRSVVRSCHEQLSGKDSQLRFADEAALVLAILLCGRRLDNLLSLDVSLDIGEQGTGLLGVSWSLPKPKLLNEWRTKLYQSTERPGIILPPTIAERLVKIRQSGRDKQGWQQSVRQFLSTVPSVIGQSITLPRLEHYFFYKSGKHCLNRFEQDFISNRPIEQNHQHYYVAFDTGPVIEKHMRYMAYILGLAPQEELLLMPAAPSTFFGSKLALTDEGVRSVFAVFEQKLTQISNPVQAIQQRDVRHNWYTAYVITVLQLATLHRPVNNIFGSLDAFCGHFTSVIIRDKGDKSARRVPLCKAGRRVLKAYLKYLAELKVHVAASQPAVANVISQILNAELPLFHFWHKDSLIPFTSTFMDNLLSQSLPLPLNWHRHAVATALMQQLVDRAYLAAFMGHELPLDRAFSRHSALDYQGLLEISNQIAGLFKAWSIPLMQMAVV